MWHVLVHIQIPTVLIYIKYAVKLLHLIQ